MNISLLKNVLLMITISFILVATNVTVFAYTQKNQASLNEKLKKLEISSNGRIGVSAINTANNTQLEYRARERFPLGCTSKVIGVSAILKKSMTDSSLLQKRIRYTKKDLTSWAPITEKHIADGMTIAELSAAAISYSDNTAMNLLVQQLGGIDKMNAFARSIHDTFFRQDNLWPQEAMSGGQGNLNDSSTPAAMQKALQKLALSDVLATPQRELLLIWLKNNTTGNARIRAGVPRAWIVGDKTGTGSRFGTTNDIGIIWPPQRAPIVVAIYYTSNVQDAIKRDDIIASVTRIVLNEFALTDSNIQLR